jgi:hypothetical protein
VEVARFTDSCLEDSEGRLRVLKIPLPRETAEAGPANSRWETTMHKTLAVAVALASISLTARAQDAAAPSADAAAETTEQSPALSVDAPSTPLKTDDAMSFTRDELEGAIRLGAAAKGRCTGLALQDGGRAFMNALVKARYRSGTGFSIVVYAPLEWIAQQASNAAKEYRPFGISDITDELRQPVLRVIVHPDMPNNLTARGRAQTSSVQHVVLRDESKQIVSQPISKEEFPEEVSNALGAQATYMGLRALFGIDDLQRVRGPQGDGEFFVTVVGDGREEKNFKIKTKHFAHLTGVTPLVQN